MSDNRTAESVTQTAFYLTMAGIGLFVAAVFLFIL